MGEIVIPNPFNKPIPAIIHCPFCNFRHVDEGEWKDRLHHKHLCLNCSELFRIEPYCYGAPEEEFRQCDECFNTFHASNLAKINKYGYEMCSKCQKEAGAESVEE